MNGTSERKDHGRKLTERSSNSNQARFMSSTPSYYPAHLSKCVNPCIKSTRNLPCLFCPLSRGECPTGQACPGPKGAPIITGPVMRQSVSIWSGDSDGNRCPLPPIAGFALCSNNMYMLETTSLHAGLQHCRPG